MKNRALRIAEAAKSTPKLPAEDGAAPIRWSARRRFPSPDEAAL